MKAVPNSSSSPYVFDVLVVGLHLRWDGVYQRPQHLLSRIARHVPVLVVEEPQVGRQNRFEWIREGNVTLCRPYRRQPQSDAIDELTIAAIRERIGFSRPLIWLYTPMMIAIAEAFTGAPVVFDAMDELAKFAQADPRLVMREDQVLSRAEIVFCGGRSLFASRVKRARRVKCYPSGVDVDFFERARRIPAHSALAQCPKPVYGYMGVIDERIDLELVEAIAESAPTATLAMIGPTAKIDPSSLPQRQNIVYLGHRQYSDLPALLAGIDVALMPFALNESTQNISPTKTLEYLAAGKPIVSTAVPDVVADYADLITIAPDHASFIAGLSSAPQLAAQRQSRSDERTHRATWNAIAQAMIGDLAELGITPSKEALNANVYPQLLCPCAHTIARHGSKGCEYGDVGCPCSYNGEAATVAAWMQVSDGRRFVWQ